MRIIEPKDMRTTAQRKRMQPKSIGKLSLFLVIPIVCFGGIRLLTALVQQPKSPAAALNQAALTPDNAVAAVTATPPKLKIYSGEEFRDLYNSFAYPNTIEITDPITITGNPTADDRIRALAEQRGYRKHSVPVADVSKVDGFSLQQKAVQPWLDMKNSAAKEDIKLGITAAFRSPAEQRLIFMQQLNATGVTAEEIADGAADYAVNKALQRSSIPGYSRHHPGYALDISCENNPEVIFAASVCYHWLSKNNYENAKKFGWIPSYPEGTTEQGPEPEAWEYVWVGVETLLE